MASNVQRMLLVTNHDLFRDCLVSGLATRIPRLAIDTAEAVKQGYELCDSQEYTLAVFDADPPDPFSPAMTRVAERRVVITGTICEGVHFGRITVLPSRLVAQRPRYNHACRRRRSEV